MTRKTSILLLGMFLVTGCASRQLQPGTYEQQIQMLSTSSVDWRQTGDSLAARIDSTIAPLRKQGGKAKRQLAISGGVATFVGAASAALIGAADKDDTKAGIGLSTSIVAAGIGLYQVVKGISRDGLGYVVAADQVIGVWRQDIAAADNDTQRKAAYLKLLNGARELKQNFPEFADFDYVVSPVAR